MSDEEHTSENGSDKTNVFPLFKEPTITHISMEGYDLFGEMDAFLVEDLRQMIDCLDRRDETCYLAAVMDQMIDMMLTVKDMQLVWGDEKLWNATKELQNCIAKIHLRNKELQEDSEENDE
jgi:hypothetical protein